MGGEGTRGEGSVVESQKILKIDPGLCVFVGLLAYHDNSKLRASIFTKLGL